MKRIATFFGITVLMLASVFGQASDQPAKDEKKPAFFCPVVGIPKTNECLCPSGYCAKRPSPKITADYRGGKLQFCCGACVDAFKKTPAKFAVAANHQLVATGQAWQHSCPNCSSALPYMASHPNVEVAGLMVNFCKLECKAKFMEASAKDRTETVFGDKTFAKAFGTKEKK